MNKQDRKRLAILDVLSGSERPQGSAKITDALTAQGIDISERTVRLYLAQTDRDGLTENLGRRGRRITDLGRTEADASRVFERVGMLSGKIDTMAYCMDFDPTRCDGTVVVNVSVVNPDDITAEHLRLINKVFAKGYAMGTRMGLLKPEETIGGTTVPPGSVGIATVCSITLNGVLLRYGVPTHSLFGGLLELQGGHPKRFVELINYNGTTVDPLEMFIRSGLADYIGAVTKGDGRIGASFREFPARSVDTVGHVGDRLASLGLGSLMCLGHAGQPIYDIPVGPERVGAVVIGGLNPMSIFEETGLRPDSRALCGLLEYHRLFHHGELRERLAELG